MAERVGVKLTVEDLEQWKSKIDSARDSLVDLGDEGPAVAAKLHEISTSASDTADELDSMADEADDASDNLDKLGRKSLETKAKTGGLLGMLKGHIGTFAKFGGIGTLIITALPAVLSMGAAFLSMAGAIGIAAGAIGALSLGLVGIIALGFAASKYATSHKGTSPAALRAQGNPIQAQFIELGRSIHKIFAPVLADLAPVVANLLKKVQPIIEGIAHLFARYVAPLLRALEPIVVGTLRGISTFSKSLMPFVLHLFQSLLPFLRTIGHFVIDIAQRTLPLFAGFFDAVFATIVQMLPTLSRLVKEFLPGALSLLTVILKAFGPLVTALMEIGKAGITPLISLFKIVVSVFGDMLVALTPAVKIVLPIFMRALKSLLPFLVPLAKMVGQVAKAFAPLLPILVRLLLTVLRPLIHPLTKLLTQFAHLAIILLPALMPLFKQLAQGLAGLLKIVAKLIKWVNDHLTTKQAKRAIDSGVGGGIPLVGSLSQMWQAAGGGLGNLGGAWTGIKSSMPSFEGLGSGLGSTLANAYESAGVLFADLLGGAAAGGPAFGGRPMVVGEHGPEVFMPHANGKIIPNHRASWGSNVTVNVYARSDNPRELARLVTRALQDQVARA